MLPDFDLIRVRDIDEAVAVLDEDHVPVWGGTELLMAMSMGLLRPGALVDITRVPQLRGVRVDGDELVVGAGTTHREVERDPVVGERLPMLAGVARDIGNARVRAQGTIGGNLCFAEPRSDVATALIALRAQVVLAAGSGGRTLAVEEFIEGPYTTSRRDSELLVEVRIPLRDHRHSRYVKFQTMERPTVGVAAVADEESCRVVVGAVGPTPVAQVVGGSVDDSIEELMSQVEPLPDLAGGERYKRHITELYVRKALEGWR